MAKQVDYYLSLTSPWAYFGSRRLEQILTIHGAEIAIKPVDFTKIFPASGGMPLAKRAPQRQAYRFIELRRWREYLGMPLIEQPKCLPVAEGIVARAVTATRLAYGNTAAMKLAHALLYALWAEEKNTADPNTFIQIAASVQRDGERILATASSAETNMHYDADTEEALQRGIFGAPSYVFEGEIFWGQDRLEFLDRALAKA